MEHIEIYKKPILETFVTILGEEYLLSDIFVSINEILNTRENDTYGDYSLRDYEITDLKTMDLLCKLDFVKNYRGSRMANLYCLKNEEKLLEFESNLEDLKENLEK